MKLALLLTLLVVIAVAVPTPMPRKKGKTGRKGRLTDNAEDIIELEEDSVLSGLPSVSGLISNSTYMVT